MVLTSDGIDLCEFMSRLIEGTLKYSETICQMEVNWSIDVHISSQVWLGFGERRGRDCFYLLSLWFDFHRIDFPGKEGAPQVNGEEPQIRPGLYSHNFLILPALDTTPQWYPEFAASWCKSLPRILVDPATILNPPRTNPPSIITRHSLK